jgi:hypothetical protein
MTELFLKEAFNVLNETNILSYSDRKTVENSSRKHVATIVAIDLPMKELIFHSPQLNSIFYFLSTGCCKYFFDGNTRGCTVHTRLLLLPLAPSAPVPFERSRQHLLLSIIFNPRLQLLLIVSLPCLRLCIPDYHLVLNRLEWPR